MHKSSFLILFYFLIVFNSIAQPAAIDSSFNKAGGNPGIFETRFYGKEEEARMIVAQSDEKLVMVGTSLNGSDGHVFTCEESIRTERLMKVLHQKAGEYFLFQILLMIMQRQQKLIRPEGF